MASRSKRANPFGFEPRRPDGFRSGFEARFARGLERDGVPNRYESVTLEYTVPAKTRRYTPDFEIEMPDGTKFLVELKGMFTSDDRKKLRCVRTCHPDLDLRIIFYRASSRITKLSRTTYGQWATDNGFPWAELPKGDGLPLSWNYPPAPKPAARTTRRSTRA